MQEEMAKKYGADVVGGQPQNAGGDPNFLMNRFRNMLDNQSDVSSLASNDASWDDLKRCREVCGRWLNDNTGVQSGTLDNRIKALQHPPIIKDALHQLRLAGNPGSHRYEELGRNYKAGNMEPKVKIMLQYL